MNTLADAFSIVITNSWQAAFVILLVLAVRGLLGPRLAPRWRHLLWTLVLVRLLIPSAWLPASPVSLQNVAALQQPIEQMRTTVDQSSVQTIVPNAKRDSLPVNVRTDSSMPEPITVSPMRWSRWDVAAGVWLSGALLGGAVIMAAQISLTRRIASSVLPVPTRVARVFARSCSRFAPARRPALLLSSAVDSPLLIGLWRPCIVLPQAASEDYSDEELEHIFAHELAHFHRHDVWTRFLQLGVVCLHWFNPLVWLACRTAQHDCELAADEWALVRLHAAEPRAYGRTLLKLVSTQSSAHFTPSTLGIAEDYRQLKSRLLSIEGFGERRWIDSVAGLVLVGGLSWMALSTKSIASSLVASDTIYDRNGVVLVSHRSSAAPRYPYKALAAQTLGFVSADTNEGHGVQGLLKGAPHTAARLTLDARVQVIAENAMREAHVTRGAVVVMDPRNGDVLALASLPSYDPNSIYVSPGSLQALQKDSLSPLSNRPFIASLPGSIFTPLVALAGLNSGKTTPQTKFDCPASIQIGDHVFWNLDRAPAGRLNLNRAITVSNEVYFYQYGLLTGIDAVDRMGERSGFGKKWNVLMGLDEDAGTLPGPDWMKRNEARLEEMHNPTQWSNAQTASTVIGQGYLAVTPLQVSAFTCAVANGGTVYRPRLVISPDLERGAKIKPSEGRVFGSLGVTPSDLEAVQQAMLNVVKAPDGTGREAQISGVDVAGKTGNAQVYRRIDGVVTPEVNAWFTCYAPFEKPRYVVTVFVNGGHWGGTTSAPIAKQILTQLFRMDQGHPVDLKPVEP